MPILGGGVESERVAKWFVLVAVFNAFMAVVFLAPFLIPAPVTRGGRPCPKSR